MKQFSGLDQTWQENAARVLVLGAWFGLFTGFGEVLLVAVKKLYLHRIVRLSPDVVWMAPVADVALFLLAAALVIAIGSLWPRMLRVGPASGVLASLGFFTLSLHYTPVHLAAKALLAIGLGTQVGRLVAAHPASFARLTSWRVLVCGALAVSLVGGAVHLRERLDERAAFTRLAEGAVGPNVLLIVWDTVRARSLSLYGYERETTPYLESIGAASAVFDLALTTAPWTLPTHASMFTGRWHHELSADWDTPLDGAHPTLAEFLSARGFATAGFVANTFYGSFEHGLDRGFSHYEDYGRSAGQILVSSALGSELACGVRNRPACGLRDLVGYYDLLGRKPAAGVSQSFLRWLDVRPDNRPFFVFLNYFDAHAPYLPPEPFASRFGEHERKNPMHLEKEDWGWTPEQVRAERDAYDGAIAHLDHELARLFDALRERGLLGQTIVIITSDHGEEFLEHGVMSHSNSLYLPSLHVPLVIHSPGRIGPARVAETVSLRDLPATVMDLLDIRQHPFPGRSLVRGWNTGGTQSIDEAILTQVSGRTFRPDHYPVSKGDMASVVESRYHLIRRGDGREELYDLAADPWETEELAAAEHAELLSRLRVRLDHGDGRHARRTTAKR